MSKSPAFQFYAQDFLVGVRFFTTEETGAYILLLIEQWDKGFIEKDEKILKKITGISLKKLENVLKKFSEVEGRLINERLEKERNKKIEFIEKQRLNGKKGGRPENPTETQPKPKPFENTNPNESSSSSTSISSSTLISKSIDKKNLVDISSDTQSLSYLENKKLSDQIGKFFSVSEQSNYQVYKLIARFVSELERSGKLDQFKLQFEAYCKFKTESKSPLHNVKKFMGYDKDSFELDIDKGAWCECDWVDKLSKLAPKDSNPNSLKNTSQTAELIAQF